MYYYQDKNAVYGSLLPDLPLKPLPQKPDGDLNAVLFSDNPSHCRASYCLTDARQLTTKEGISWLDTARMSGSQPNLPTHVMEQIKRRTLRAVNIRHPRWHEIINRPPDAQKARVHLLAVGDVGSTLLIGLKLLGGTCISSLGICDLSAQTTARWVAELGQISRPRQYDELPEVEAISPENLFDCDVFLFAATKSIPAVGATVSDVRMAQFDANRSLVEHFAVQSREAGYRGKFIVVSDPVDPLAKAAFLASNRSSDGTFDGKGLLPEQIRGFGLGVMNARAAALAKQNLQYASFLTEGRSYGPHGQGLIIANSLTHYDDALSRKLTDNVTTANLRIRDLGFKPYVAPALSSGALSLLALLEHNWHCSSVFLGGTFFGVYNRETAVGIETESDSLPEPLFKRIAQSYNELSKII